MSREWSDYQRQKQPGQRSREMSTGYRSKAGWVRDRQLAELMGKSCMPTDKEESG